MSADCQRCPELAFRLSALRLQVQAVSRRIEAELDEQATMSRKDLLRLVQQRLEGVADTAGES